MPTSCSVIGCKSRANAGPKKQFFRFPLNRPKVLMQWLMVIDRMDWTPKTSSKICSEHFASEDFLLRPNVNVPRLKPEAVPSIFPDPNSTQEEPTDDDETLPQESLLNGDDENPIQDQENLNENTINTVAAKQPEKSTPIISDDIYSKRPRRTSKINVKMKDFILLDDLRKLNKPLLQEAPKTKLVEKNSAAVKIKSENFKLDVSTESESVALLESKSEVEVSKVDAAKELLSILEDSDDEVITSLPIGPKSLTKIPQPTVKISEIASKVKAASHPLRAVPLTDAQRVKQPAKVLKTVTMSSGKKISMAKIAQQNGAVLVSQSPKSQILLAASIASRPDESNDVQSESVTESSEKIPQSDEIPMGIRTKRPSTDFATTYFPIRCGENFFYFSYADLNPVVNLSHHNALVNEVLQTNLTTPKNKTQTKKNLKRKNMDLDKINGNRQHTADLNSAITENINSALTGRCVELEINNESEAYQTDDYDSPTVQGDNSALFSDLASENSMDYQLASDDIIDENVGVVSSPIKRRKKKFKTVAEIVVRTDNTKPGEAPSVSIDKIVDFKADKAPALKTLKRGRPNQGSAHMVDVNDNLNNVPSTNEIESSEEELARLSERITETVKKMNLLDKVKGNTSKLTVLITTLPPIKEKEILIVKKKNLDSNTVQSRELQVVISSNKANDSTLHGNIVVTNPLGYTILPANKSSVHNSENYFRSINSDEAGTSTNPEQEHATVLCYQEKSGNMEASESNLLSFTNHNVASTSSENIELSDTLNESMISDETEEMGKKPTEVIKHDHPYISPNVKYLLTTPNVTVNLAELQPKETGSKMKLTENEIIFRNKVGKKVRSLKDTVKKRNDAISKLKEKIKFLERTLKEVKRIKKPPAKSSKKEMNSSMKNDIYYEVDQLVDTSDFSNSIDYSLNNIELPHGLDENAEDSEDDDGERECSSPITYLCEPAIESASKEREIVN